MLSNFKMFDKKGRHVAIFGRPTYKDGLMTMEICVYTCSLKDRFLKSKAWELLTTATGHPEKFYVRMKEDGQTTSVFQNFCRNEYYVKMWKKETIERLYLYRQSKRNNMIPTSTTQKFGKL